MQDLGDINPLLLPQTIFNFTLGKDMVFWQCYCSIKKNSDVMIDHVITMTIKVNGTYFLSKYG